MKLTYDIQEIENVLADFCKSADLSKHIFKGQRPSNSKVPMKSFLVVSVPSGVTDLAAYGRCSSRIEIFVKNLSNGTKNGDEFSLIYKKLVEAFPIQNDTYLFDTHPNIIQLGNDKNGYFVQAININTIIKSIQ